MSDNETPVISSLLMDRSTPIANSLSSFDNRRAIHVKALQYGTWSNARTWVLSASSDFVSAVQSGNWSVFQAGAWTTGRTWLLAASSDSIAAVQSGSWTTGRTWVLAASSDSVSAAQSGTWTTGRTWLLSSSSDSVTSFQGGTWTVQPGNTQNTTPWVVTRVDGQKNSYVAATINLAVSTTTPTDVFTIFGSNTKTIRITRVSCTAQASSAVPRNVLLIKRSSVNSGGTSSSVTAVPHDSTSPVASATVLAYTVNPTTLGTQVGLIHASNLVVGDVKSLTSDRFIMEFGIRPSKAIVLRGSSEGLCFNLNSIATLGNTWNFNIEWTEE